MSPSRQSALVAALLAVTALSCAPVKPKGRPVEYQGFYATFKSGLRLVVYENPNAAEFMFSASYDSGAADEPAGQEGIAHLAEHLAFRAAHGPVGAPSVWDRLVGGGLVFNGVTTHDHTDYWELGKPDQLQLAIAIEADRMYEPLAGIGEKELATEREVVISELLERSAAGGDEWDWLAAVGMPGHPYGKPVAGSVESLRRIQLDDVRS